MGTANKEKGNQMDADIYMLEGYVYLKKSDINVKEEIDKLKQNFATFMEEDLLFDESRREELWVKYQSCIDQTENELNKIVSRL